MVQAYRNERQQVQRSLEAFRGLSPALTREHFNAAVQYALHHYTASSLLAALQCVFGPTFAADTCDSEQYNDTTLVLPDNVDGTRLKRALALVLDGHEPRLKATAEAFATRTLLDVKSGGLVVTSAREMANLGVVAKPEPTRSTAAAQSPPLPDSATQNTGGPSSAAGGPIADARVAPGVFGAFRLPPPDVPITSVRTLVQAVSAASNASTAATKQLTRLRTMDGGRGLVVLSYEQHYNLAFTASVWSTYAQSLVDALEQMLDLPDIDTHGVLALINEDAPPADVARGLQLIVPHDNEVCAIRLWGQIQWTVSACDCMVNPTVLINLCYHTNTIDLSAFSYLCFYYLHHHLSKRGACGCAHRIFTNWRPRQLHPTWKYF